MLNLQSEVKALCAAWPDYSHEEAIAFIKYHQAEYPSVTKGYCLTSGPIAPIIGHQQKELRCIK